MRILDGFIASSYVRSSLCASCVCHVFSVSELCASCRFMWRRVSKVAGPLGEHVGGVQSLKPMGNPH